MNYRITRIYFQFVTSTQLQHLFTENTVHKMTIDQPTKIRYKLAPDCLAQIRKEKIGALKRSYNGCYSKELLAIWAIKICSLSDITFTSGLGSEIISMEEHLIILSGFGIIIGEFLIIFRFHTYTFEKTLNLLYFKERYICFDQLQGISFSRQPEIVSYDQL